MGLGDTAKRLKLIAEKAEKVYEQIIALRNQVLEVKETLDETNDRVSAVEGRLERQEAILAAVAEEHDVDVDALVASIEDTADDGDDEGDSDAGDDDETTNGDGETTESEDDSQAAEASETSSTDDE